MKNTAQNSTKTIRRRLSALGGLIALTVVPQTVQAQEIPLTGPLAGAPAVRNQRLYREGRFMGGLSVGATLLDEYQQNFTLGGRLGYNFLDWLGLEVFGAYAINNNLDLVNKTQEVNVARREENRTRINQQDAEGVYLDPTQTSQLTDINISQNFGEQLGSINFMIAPQLTVIPFRGKIAIFQEIYVDTEMYFFGGPAFVGVTERSDCAAGVCGTPRLPPPNADPTAGPQWQEADLPNSWDGDSAANRGGRLAIAPTFGLGVNFYPVSWLATGLEWRAFPFNRNTGGFDNHGDGPDNDFPDLAVTGADSDFKFNNMVSLNFTFFLPLENESTE